MSNKFFKKLNMVDWVAVALVIVALGFGTYKSVGTKEVEPVVNTQTNTVQVVKPGGEVIASETTATVRYRIMKIRDITLENLTEGAWCYYPDGRTAGSMKNVETENYYEYGLNDNNKYVKFDYDDRFNVYFELELPGRHTRSAFNGLDWVPVGAGTVHYYSIGGVTYECMVTEVVLNE